MIPHSGLVYERRGECAEAWVRVSIEHTPGGARVVIEEGHARYSLAPTLHVLEGVTRNLRTITPEELATGTVTLGPLGVRALQVLSGIETAA